MLAPYRLRAAGKSLQLPESQYPLVVMPVGDTAWLRGHVRFTRIVNRINGRRNCIIASGVLSACACLSAGDVHCRFSGQGCFIWPTQHNAFSCMHFQDESLGISLEVEISDLSCLKIWQLWAHWLPVNNQLGWEDAASLGWTCALWLQWHKCQQQYLCNVYYGRQERPPRGGDQQYPHFTDEIVEIEIDDR